MRTGFYCFIFAFFVIAGIPPVLAGPQFQVRLSQDQIPVSKTATLSIQIEWPRQEAQYQFALPALPLENLTLVRQGQSQEIFPGKGGDWTRKIFNFELQAMKPGAAIIQAFDLPYIDPVLQKGGRFHVSVLKLNVLRPSAAIQWISLSTAGFILVAALAGLAFWRLQRRISDPKSELPVQAAAEEFRKLLENRVSLDDDLVPALNHHLRSFLAETYQIPAGQTTENELLRSLESAALPHEELEIIKSILNELEEIKYVGRPTEAQFHRLQKDLLRFIHSKQVLGNPS